MDQNCLDVVFEIADDSGLIRSIGTRGEDRFSVRGIVDLGTGDSPHGQYQGSASIIVEYSL